MTNKAPKCSGDWAYLDVKKGRHALEKLVDGRGYSVPVTVTGMISGLSSGDDGTSIEFQVDVSKFKLGKPIKRS